MHFGSMLETAGVSNSGLKRKAWKMGGQKNTCDLEMSLLLNTKDIQKENARVTGVFGEGKEKSFSARPYFLCLA